MKRGSLTFRILAMAAITIAAAIFVVWLLLTRLFEREIAARHFAELDGHLGQLSRIVELDAQGDVILSDDMGEPRFNRPLSGLYWQIMAVDGTVPLASPSLWDETLALPAAGPEGSVTRRDRVLHADGVLMTVERVFHIGFGASHVPYRLVVALDRAELEAARDAFGGRVLALTAAVGLLLMAAAGFMAFVGLRPLRRLRLHLKDLHKGATERLEGPFPSEIQGLADELNHVLDSRDAMIEGARARAADLAHGLKTPLAVLGAESRNLAAVGQGETAAAINAQIDRMHRNVERELVRARVGLRGGTRALRLPLAPSVKRLTNALSKLPDADQLEWAVSVDDAIEIAMERTDFEEVAGNLLDNARKWATSRIHVTAAEQHDTVRVEITDDGPGVPKDQLDAIVERGRRLDQAIPGTGLGLAIARDILDLYGGDMSLEHATPTGLRIQLTLPKPQAIPA